MSARAYYSEDDRCWYAPVAWEAWNKSQEGDLLPVEPARLELKDGQLLITPLEKVTRDDGLTKDEGRVHDALIEAVNQFARLPSQHPDEMRDFVDGVHKCQDQLAVRIARRHYPKGWPIKDAGVKR